MHPYYHALSSVYRFGGNANDYLPIHNWFDETKSSMINFRHRAGRHHTEGIFWCQDKFGFTIPNKDSSNIPVRLIAEQHVKEDLGFIPSMKDWLMKIHPDKWMFVTNRVNAKTEDKLSQGIPCHVEFLPNTNVKIGNIPINL